MRRRCDEDAPCGTLRMPDALSFVSPAPPPVTVNGAAKTYGPRVRPRTDRPEKIG